MTDERFHISFAGECLEGRDPAEVRAGLAKLFKADSATLDRLFSGKLQRIKRDCDKVTAAKYQKSMAAAGARAIVTRASEETQEAAAREARQQTPAAGSAGIELAPAGSDVLTPGERRQPAPAEVDTSHLSLGEPGQALTEGATQPEPAVSVPEYAISEVGARLAPEVGQAPPPAPDISGLDLSPAGADLAAAAAPAEHVEVSTEHLSLSQAGEDLLQESERRRDTASAPDTSHLELSPPSQKPE